MTKFTWMELGAKPGLGFVQKFQPKQNYFCQEEGHMNHLLLHGFDGEKELEGVDRKDNAGNQLNDHIIGSTDQASRNQIEL